MKKKLFCLLLVVALMISCGCGNGNVSEDTGDSAESTDAENVADESDQMDQDGADESENVDSGQEEPSTDEENDGGQENQDEEVAKYHLNDIVITDLVEFKLIDAEFAFFDSSERDETYTTPVANSDGVTFNTHRGQTFVCMTFEVTNLDRTGLSFGQSFFASDPACEFVFDAIYNNNTYEIKDIGLGANGLDMTYSYVTSTDVVILPIPETTNVILDAGATMTVQTLGQINTEVDDLSDSFEMLIRLPNSSGELEEFIYEIDNGSDQ